MSNECKDFISKLLDKNPSTRLGSKKGAGGDVNEIINHPWIKDTIDINAILDKEIKAPVVPKLAKDKLDLGNFST